MDCQVDAVVNVQPAVLLDVVPRRRVLVGGCEKAREARREVLARDPSPPPKPYPPCPNGSCGESLAAALPPSRFPRLRRASAGRRRRRSLAAEDLAAGRRVRLPFLHLTDTPLY